MERRNFIKQCGVFGASCIGLSVVLNACKAGSVVTATVTNNKLQVPKTEFEIVKEDKKAFKKVVVVRTDSLAYPIAVYRFSETEMKALLLSCTHQGVELSVSGDVLTCSAHGSEFSNKGEVLQGPADTALKSFPVTSDEQNIYIHLS